MKLTAEQQDLVAGVKGLVWDEVRKVVAWYKIYDPHLRDELFSDAMLITIRGALYYKPEMNCKFTTYLLSWLRKPLNARARLMVARRSWADCNQYGGNRDWYGADLSEPPPIRIEDVKELLAAPEHERHPSITDVVSVKELVDYLVTEGDLQRLREIILRRSEGKTLLEISEGLGITKERVRQLQAYAITTLQRNIPSSVCDKVADYILGM